MERDAGASSTRGNELSHVPSASEVCPNLDCASTRVQCERASVAEFLNKMGLARLPRSGCHRSGSWVNPQEGGLAATG